MKLTLHPKHLYGLVAAFFLFASPARSEIARQRSSYFSFSLAQERYNWFGSDDARFLASGSHISFGYGQFFPAGLLIGQGTIVVGPFPFGADTLLSPVYQGSGASILAGVSLRGGDLRRFTHNLGPLVGVEYSELTGKALPGMPEQRITIGGLSLSTGIFYSWLQAPRLSGNTPELLDTRLDGILTSFSCTFPLSIKKADERLWGTTLRFAVHFLIGP